MSWPMNTHTYLVCTIKSWNIEAFKEFTPGFPGRWELLSQKDDLSLEYLKELNPRYIFFPHWSWIVPKDILQNFECVCFHMSDVPYGRGGSPLQNLIVRGHKNTKLTALKMCEELDAGPVYSKQDLSLQGAAHEILSRAGRLSLQMAKEIVIQEPKPYPQEGETVVFKRRTSEMSEIPKDINLEGLFDHIRMLDGEGYPPAFIEYGEDNNKKRFEFSEAQYEEGVLTAKVIVKTKAA